MRTDPISRLQRVLLIEDSAVDAALVEHELRQHAPGLHLERVETRVALETALSAGSWDVVLSDFHLPRFSALEALQTLASAGQDLPLVVISGFVGEEAAAALIKAGASDFVTKSNLGHLRAAIDRALREAQAMRERKAALAELTRSRSQLRELSEHLELAKERERASIAREIHDELGVVLTAAKMEIATLTRNLPADRLDLVSGTTTTEALIDQAMDASRRISRRLRPAILDYGVVAAIEWQTREFSKRLGAVCEFDSSLEEVDLDPDRATAVFRILQESLTNAARHARAGHVRVTLTEDPGRQLTLRVTDDGCGIAPGDADKHGSFGLRGMRERALSLGGELRVAPAVGGGTEVSLRVPLASPGTKADGPTQLSLEA